MYSPLQHFGEKTVGRKDINKQFSRYSESIIWLYKNLYLYDKARLIMAVVLNVGGATLRGGTLSLLMLYASLMESGRPIEILDYEFYSREPNVFIISIISLGLFMLISSGLFFFGGKAIVKLSVDFATYCSRNCLILGGFRAPRNSRPSQNFVPKKVSTRISGIVMMARGLRPLLQISNPATMIIYSLGAVLYIDPLITAMLGVVVGFSLLLQYLVNYYATQNQKQMGFAKRRANQRIFQLISRYSLAPKIYKSEQNKIKKLYQGEDIQELLNRYSFRVLAARYSGMISDAVFAISVMILFIYLGLKALDDDISWAYFLGYVIFARVLLVSTRGFMASITGFARHYPTLREVYEMLSSRTKIHPSVESPEVEIRRSKDGIGDMNSFQLKQGELVTIISNIPISRFNLYAFVDALAGRDKMTREKMLSNTTCIPDTLESFPGGNILELVGLENDASNSDLKKRLSELNFQGYKAPFNLKRPLSTNQWRQLPSNLRANILLAAGVDNCRFLLLVEDTILKAADPEYLKNWRRLMNKCHIAIRCSTATEVNGEPKDLALALGQDGSISLMTKSWCKNNTDKVNQWIRTHTSEESPDGFSDESDDDD